MPPQDLGLPGAYGADAFTQQFLQQLAAAQLEKIRQRNQALAEQKAAADEQRAQAEERRTQQDFEFRTADANRRAAVDQQKAKDAQTAEESFNATLDASTDLTPQQKTIIKLSRKQGGAVPWEILQPKPPSPGSDFNQYLQSFLESEATKKGVKVDELTPAERSALTIDARKQFQDAPQDPALAALHKELLGFQIQNAKNTAESAPTPEQIHDTAMEVVQHRVAPSQLTQLYGGFGQQGQAFKREVMAMVRQIDKNFNAEEAESNYQFGKAPGTQLAVRMIDNIGNTLPILEQASQDFKRSGVQVINKALLASNRQFGSTHVVRFDTARQILADEIAKIFTGGGTGAVTSDAKLHQAQDILKGDMTVGQMDAALATLKELFTARREKLTEGTYKSRSQPDAGGGGATGGGQQPGDLTYDAATKTWR